MRKAIIVASGPSLLELDRTELVQTAKRANATIIAVNGAADWLPTYDLFFTLDPSKKNIDRMNEKLEGVDYYCAYEIDLFYKLPPHVNKLIRKKYEGTMPKGLEPDSDEWWLYRWKCKTGLSETWPEINTGNSAYGALGLSYLLGYTNILILGLDATQHARINGEGEPEYSLKHLPLLFSSAKKQLQENGIQVVNGSLESRVTCFPRTTPQLGLEWIENVKE